MVSKTDTTLPLWSKKSVDEKEEKDSGAVTKLHVLWGHQVWHLGNGAERVPR